MKIKCTKTLGPYKTSPPWKTHEQAETTNIVELRAWHCSPKRINGVHWTSPCIKLKHMSSFIGLRVEFCCIVHWIALHYKLCYTMLQTVLRHVTLQTFLCYTTFEFYCAMLWALLHNTTLHFMLYCATNSIVLHYGFARLHYVATLLHCVVNSTMLHCEFYRATLHVLLCYISSFTMLC